MDTERTGDADEEKEEESRSRRTSPGREQARSGRTIGDEPVATRKPFSLTVRIGAPIGDEDDDDSEP